MVIFTRNAPRNIPGQSQEPQSSTAAKPRPAGGQTAEALAGLFDPNVEAVPAWRGTGTTYSGIEGFREMWLDWLQPWATYHVQVEEMIEVGDRVVVLVRDSARRHDMDVEVELISGSVWSFRDGKIARVEFHANRHELRAATGVGL